MDGETVLVIGSALLDIRVTTHHLIQSDDPQLGQINTRVHGVARNIAENLARLEVDTVLLSAVANNDIGQHLLTQTTQSGVDCDYVLRVDDMQNASTLTLKTRAGTPITVINDYDIMDFVDTDYLLENESLFQDAALIVIDATLTTDALDTLFELASRYNVRVCADPTSPLLASKLCDYIPNLYLVVPNASETAALCPSGESAINRESAIQTARTLVALGADIAVVTLGEMGLAYADHSGGGYIRAVQTEIVDTTGAGDALSGAVIFGILNDVPVDEAMRLGVTAASLTLESAETVMPTLSQELLYDAISV